VPLVVWLLADVPVAGWGGLAVAIGVGLVPYGLTVLAVERVSPRLRFGLRVRSGPRSATGVRPG
jgi:hypothetical protein